MIQKTHGNSYYAELKRLKPHDVLCFLYTSDEEYQDFASSFIKIGLETHEKCLLVLDTHFRRDIRTFLKNGGIDVNTYEKTGQLALPHGSQVYSKNRIFTRQFFDSFLIMETEKALVAGFSGIRFIFEMDWLAQNMPGSEDFRQYKTLLFQDFFKNHPCIAAFEYDRRRFHPPAIKEALLTHPLFAHNGQLFTNYQYITPDQYTDNDFINTEIQYWMDNIKRENNKEKELTLTTKKMDLLFQDTSAIVMVLNESGYIIDVNPSAIKFFECSRLELINTPIWDYCLPEALEMIRLDGVDTPLCRELEFLINGNIKSLSLNTIAVTDAGRKMNFLIGQDVTSVKETSTALKTNRERYQALIETTSDFIWEMDVSWRYTYCSPQVYSLWGYTPESFTGQPCFKIIPEETRYKAMEFLKKLEIAPAPFTNLEVQIIDSRQNYHFVEVSGVPFFDESGQLAGYRGITRDITTRKMAETAQQASETRYRQLFDSMSEGFSVHKLVLNSEGVPCDYTFNDVNPAFEALTGLKKENIIGKNVTDILRGLESSWIETYARVALTGNPVRFENYTQTLGKWFEIFAFSPKTGYFATIFSDVTARKEMEENLKKSEQRFKAIVEQSSVAINLTRGTELMFANPAYLKMFGYSSLEELKRMPPLATVVPGFRPMVANNIALRNQGLPVPSDYEVDCLHKDGSIIPVRMYFNRIFLIDGPATFGIMIDLTEQKLAEEARRESDEFRSTLLDHAPNPVIVRNSDLEVIYVNPAFEKLSGFTSEEACGLKFPVPWWHDTGNSSYSEGEGPNPQKWITSEVSLTNKSGKSIWVQSTTGPVIQGHKLKYVITQLTDISDRKKAENLVNQNNARLESLLKITQFPEDSVPRLLDFALDESIKLTGSKIGYIYLYDESKKEFTLNTWSREVAPVCTVREPQTLYHLDQTGIWGEAVRQQKAIIVNDFQAPNPLKRGLPHGHAPLYRFMTIPVFDGNHIVAVVGVANKASEYDEADVRQLTLLMNSVWKIVLKRSISEELRITLEKLREVYELEKTQRIELQEEAHKRGMFINVLGHELRTPLTPLIACSSMLNDIWPSQNKNIEKNLIAAIHKSSLNLGEKLEDLLDLGKFSRGTFRLNKSRFNLQEVITKIEAGYYILAQKQNISFHVELIPEGLDGFEGDSSRIEQVIDNLLSNAFKFSAENSTVDLKVYRLNNQVVMEVHDTGIGISAEDQKKLFEPYHRVEQDSQSFPGIGLGLAISKQIVEAHGGTISVTSQPGHGSIFTVKLPYGEQ